jgi:hypothetical protein
MTTWASPSGGMGGCNCGGGSTPQPQTGQPANPWYTPFVPRPVSLTHTPQSQPQQGGGLTPQPRPDYAPDPGHWDPSKRAPSTTGGITSLSQLLGGYPPMMNQQMQSQRPTGFAPSRQSPFMGLFG